MFKNQAFSFEKHGQSKQIHDEKFGVIPLFSSAGLKIVNPLTKEMTLFDFRNEYIMMDWNDYLAKTSRGEEKDLFVTIFGHDPNSTSILKGDAKCLTSIYQYCVGRYISKKRTQFLTLRTLYKESYFSLSIVRNSNDEKQYYEKVLLMEPSNQDQEMSFHSQKTEFDENIIPEEISIILQLQRAQAPHILPVESIFFDEKYFSYIYSKQKDMIEITKFMRGIQEETYCLIIHVARQLIKLLITLEEKEIVFPSIHHKNLYINIDTLDIMIITYSQAYFSQKNETRRRCANFGYTPPEYFAQDENITSKANIYQFGVLLFYLLFDQTPYGKTHSDIVKNTLQKKTDLTLLKGEKPTLHQFVMLLLEKDQRKRPTAKQLLGHSLFNSQSVQRYSKLSINGLLKIDDQTFQSCEEFDQFNKISNIHLVRQKQVKIKFQGIF